MGGLAAFIGGAAKSVKARRDADYAAEQELAMAKRKAEMIAQLQKQYETLAKGVDLASGEAFTIYGDGTESRAKLPEGYVAQQRAAQEAETLDRRMKQDEISSRTDYNRARIEAAGSTAESNRIKAEAARESARTRGIADQARAGYYNRSEPGKKSDKDPNVKVEKDVDAAFKLFSNEGIPPTVAAAARRIRFSTNLTPQKKLEALNELFDATE